MQIRFRDSDISALNLKGSELTALGLGAVTRTTSSATDFTSVTTATSSSTSASTSSMVPTGGLSTGARVAIGVVIPTVLISLCVGIYLYFRRRRIRESNSRNVQAMSALHEIRGGAVEAHGSARHEADGRIVQPQHYELDSVQLIEVEARS